MYNVKVIPPSFSRPLWMGLFLWQLGVRPVVAEPGRAWTEVPVHLGRGTWARWWGGVGLRSSRCSCMDYSALCSCCSLSPDRSLGPAPMLRSALSQSHTSLEWVAGAAVLKYRAPYIISVGKGKMVLICPPFTWRHITWSTCGTALALYQSFPVCQEEATYTI